MDDRSRPRRRRHPGSSAPTRGQVAPVARHRKRAGLATTGVAPRPPAVVNHLDAGSASEPHDCALRALSAYLGVAYTDIIRIAARVVEDGGKHGLMDATIKHIAKLCGTPLREIRAEFDPDDAYGIVIVDWRGLNTGHAAVLREGLVLDRLEVWSWEDWRNYRAQSERTKSGRPRVMGVKLLTAVAPV